MATLPPVSDLYAGLSAKEAAVQHEEFTTALTKANSAPKSAANLMGVAPSAPATPSAAIAGLLADESLTKSMSADVLSSLNSALVSQQNVQGDIVKDISLTTPLSTGLVAYDLSAPAKLIFPKMTPLRNKIARKGGFGTSHRQKIINAITGSETGVADKWAGISDTSTETFGSTTTYNRGLKIGYAGYDRTFGYKQFSLSDNVPFSAQFQGQGYQDIRQLAQTTTLYASMLFEEKALLFGRGTDLGSIGAISAPTIASAVARTKGAGEVGLTAGTYYFKVAADAGQFGASAVSSASSGIVVTAGQVVDVVINDVAGALGYEIFAGTTNANASLFYQGRTGYNTFVFGGAADAATSGTAATTVASDTSAYATGFDGIFAQIIGASSQPTGQVSRINSAFSTTNAGAEYQNMFANLYASVKADPDEILINGADRKQLSDAIKGSGTVGAYRLNISQDEANGVIAGDVVTGLHNEVTGKAVSLTVHPWMPQGNSAVLSYTLPIPDSNVSEVWAVHTVQDFMAIEWPVVDFNYSNSVYFNEVLVCSAPQFNGLIQGIKAA